MSANLKVRRDGNICDGCERSMPRSEQYVRVIDPHFSSNFMNLCASCVTVAAAMIEQATLKLSMATPEETSHAAG